MRHTLKSFFVLLTIAILSGCATDSEPTPITVHVGMSRDDLRLFFGSPIRIEPQPAGGENWIYTFRETPNPEIQTTVENDGANQSRSTSATYHLSEKHEAAIHLSADGHVIDPVPEGKIIRR